MEEKCYKMRRDSTDGLDPVSYFILYPEIQHVKVQQIYNGEMFYEKVMSIGHARKKWKELVSKGWYRIGSD